jgi:2-oxoglutarate/2-oxoacid ferredoxin oxidoreductase subunit alpha
MTATSGGGFDLMTETVSLAGMIEVPLVICIAMRPGPATGLPTWTAQGDLRLALYGGHGEFARIVIAVSDPESAFLLTQHAYDLAERFQVPVILLTDKHIAENIQTVPYFLEGPEVKRYIVTDEEMQKSSASLHRYEITDSGVSPRWLPHPGNKTFFCNGDEHTIDGVLDESVDTEKMIIKRIRKLSAIEAVLPDPVIFGNIEAPLTIIGWGSTKNVMMDLLNAQDYDGSWRYVHVEYMWPMRREFWSGIFGSQISPNPSLSRGEQEQTRGIAVLETNATGQFADLLQQQFGVILEQRFCKTNGRAFYREEVSERMGKSQGC